MIEQKKKIKGKILILNFLPKNKVKKKFYLIKWKKVCPSLTVLSIPVTLYLRK